MRKVLFALGTVTLICSAGGVDLDRAAASESVVVKKRIVKPRVVDVGSCRAAWRCGPGGCDWRRVCARRCPDGISCYPLYGAYGPYGGAGFWGAYTPSGWGWR
jgi:hypothetical protein